MRKRKKIRVNITVDAALLDEAKKKLHLFGGKLSTLFNAYLRDFTETVDTQSGKAHDDLARKIALLEARLEKIEKKSN